MTYQIKIEQFEGPLDLLLRLIEQEKMDVTKISLSKVADQYLEYINQQGEISLENLAQFLTVASRLLLIKSRALLPLLEFSEEEEEEIEDLQNQLIEYKKFRDISLEVGELFDSRQNFYAREGVWDDQKVFCPPENLKAVDLQKSFEKVLGEIPWTEKLQQDMIIEVITLEEKILHLQDRLRTRAQMNFSELVEKSQDKIEVVVSFLALLELVKQRIVIVEQGELFAEIEMQRRPVDSVVGK